MDQVNNTKQDPGIKEQRSNPNEHSNTNLVIMDRDVILDRINTSKTMAEITEFLKDFTWEERFEWMHQKKLKGNRMYNKKRFDEAIQNFSEAIMAIDFKGSEEERQRICNEIQVPCLLSMAAALKEKKEYTKALKVCDQAINSNEYYYKSYFRRGAIFQAMGEYEKALADYKKAQELCKDEVFSVTVRYAIEDLKTVEEKRSRAFKDMLEDSSIIHDEDSLNTERADLENNHRTMDDEKNKVLKYNDDLEELNRFGIFKYVAYPVKMSMKFFQERMNCCRRKKDKYLVGQSSPN